MKKTILSIAGIMAMVILTAQRPHFDKGDSGKVKMIDSNGKEVWVYPPPGYEERILDLEMKVGNLQTLEELNLSSHNAIELFNLHFTIDSLKDRINNLELIADMAMIRYPEQMDKVLGIIQGQQHNEENFKIVLEAMQKDGFGLLKKYVELSRMVDTLRHFLRPVRGIYPPIYQLIDPRDMPDRTGNSWDGPIHPTPYVQPSFQGLYIPSLGQRIDSLTIHIDSNQIHSYGDSIPPTTTIFSTDSFLQKALSSSGGWADITGPIPATLYTNGRNKGGVLRQNALPVSDPGLKKRRHKRRRGHHAGDKPPVSRAHEKEIRY